MDPGSGRRAISIRGIDEAARQEPAGIDDRSMYRGDPADRKRGGSHGSLRHFTRAPAVPCAGRHSGLPAEIVVLFTPRPYVPPEASRRRSLLLLKGRAP